MSGKWQGRPGQKAHFFERETQALCGALSVDAGGKTTGHCAICLRIARERDHHRKQVAGAFAKKAELLEAAEKESRSLADVRRRLVRQYMPRQVWGVFEVPLR